MLVYCRCTCWTPGSSRNGPMKQDLSILPLCCHSACFRGIGLLGFSEFWHGARNSYHVVCDSQIFWKNFFCPKNWGNGPKIGFFEFEVKCGQKFSLNLFYDENLFALFLRKFYIWGKSCSWDIGQNGLSQSDSRIFKSTISQKKKNC